MNKTGRAVAILTVAILAWWLWSTGEAANIDEANGPARGGDETRADGTASTNPTSEPVRSVPAETRRFTPTDAASTRSELVTTNERGETIPFGSTARVWIQKATARRRRPRERRRRRRIGLRQIPVGFAPSHWEIPVVDGDARFPFVGLGATFDILVAAEGAPELRQKGFDKAKTRANRTIR